MAKTLPQALHDRAELLARAHQLQTVAELLGLPRSTISAMKKRGWKAQGRCPLIRPIPSDFIFHSNRMTNAELCAHYRAAPRVVTRWMRECPNVRPSRRGEALRNDPATGKRVWKARREFERK